MRFISCWGISMDGNKSDYSYNVTTLHERSLPLNDTELGRIVDLWDSESTKNELPKCRNPYLIPFLDCFVDLGSSSQ